MSDSVYFVSLGCPKNLVDSEIMLGELQQRHYQMVDQPADASIIVVNTCSFIAPATQESIDTVLEMAEYKKSGKCKTLVMSGCLAQRHASDLAHEMPEVDYFIGTGEYNKLGVILEERSPQRTHVGIPLYIHNNTSDRVISKTFFSSYLKISEGCRHRCSFCIIPTLRGDLRSRTIDDIVTEAKKLRDQGIVELNIISQDTNSFGYDRVGGIGRRTELGKLLRSLGKLDGIEWIRLLYMYPIGFPEELMEVIASEPKVVKYIDMPLQHITTPMLRSMNRGVGGDKVRSLVRKLRDRIPGLTLRTTFIVGFPGETDEDFQALVDFVEEIRFERMGVFTYSPEEGTPAASIGGEVPEKEKQQRQRTLMSVQRRIAKAQNRRLVGTTQQVLVEGESDESELLLKGRMASQAPDIDGHVLINAGNARIGSLVPVKISRALDYDVIGAIVGAESEPWIQNYAV